MTAPFSETTLSISDFAQFAKIDKKMIPAFEDAGILTVARKKVGHIDRKIVTLEGMREYFQNIRLIANQGENPFQIVAQEMNADAAVAVATENLTNTSDAASGATTAGPQIPAQANQSQTEVAAATGFIPHAPKNKIQMFYNIKGGTGKSTLTAQFVMRAAMMGYNVLALDLDGQGHLSVNLNIMDAHERPSIYDVLINDLPIKDAIVNVAPGLDLVPANLGLCTIEIPLNQKTRREYRLMEALESVADQYDLIIADTNPAASILNTTMLVAADCVNVICATNPLSFHGMSLVMGTIEEMEKEFRKKLDVHIIPNMYDNREVISQEVLGELRSQFEGICTQAVINRSADLNEATKCRTTVFSVNNKGNAANDIAALTEELVQPRKEA